MNALTCHRDLYVLQVAAGFGLVRVFQVERPNDQQLHCVTDLWIEDRSVPTVDGLVTLRPHQMHRTLPHEKVARLVEQGLVKITSRKHRGPDDAPEDWSWKRARATAAGRRYLESLGGGA